jgi:uncharacterized protein
MSPSEQKERALEALAARPFRPAWWARTGFVQTVLASRPEADDDADRMERWDTADGDFVRVHFWDGEPRAPQVVLFHGLEGDRRSRYVGEFSRRLREIGWSFAMLEFRSCGGEPNILPRSYHSGETGDIAFVVSRLVERAPQRALFATGFSLGGNALMKWLGEVGERAPRQLLAAAAVSAPFDLETCARQCDERWFGVIARRFLKTLVPKATHKAREFPSLLDETKVRACTTFAAFDELVTAPLHGFANATDYWRRCSSAQFLRGVRKPALLVAASDDPLVPDRVLPREVAAESPWLVPQFVPHGGHCSFVDGGTPLRPRRWAESQVIEFFRLHAEWGAK